MVRFRAANARIYVRPSSAAVMAVRAVFSSVGGGVAEADAHVAGFLLEPPAGTEEDAVGLQAGVDGAGVDLGVGEAREADDTAFRLDPLHAIILQQSSPT